MNVIPAKNTCIRARLTTEKSDPRPNEEKGEKKNEEKMSNSAGSDGRKTSKDKYDDKPFEGEVVLSLTHRPKKPLLNTGPCLENHNGQVLYCCALNNVALA